MSGAQRTTAATRSAGMRFMNDMFPPMKKIKIKFMPHLIATAAPIKKT
jgi:hypothetical protein